MFKKNIWQRHNEGKFPKPSAFFFAFAFAAALPVSCRASRSPRTLWSWRRARALPPRRSPSRHLQQLQLSVCTRVMSLSGWEESHLPLERITTTICDWTLSRYEQWQWGWWWWWMSLFISAAGMNEHVLTFIQLLSYCWYPHLAFVILLNTDFTKRNVDFCKYWFLKSLIITNRHVSWSEIMTRVCIKQCN